MNTFLKLGLAAASALCVFAGCAADDSGTDGSSESDITAAPRAKEGDSCGTGFSGITILCDEGLECEGHPASGAADEMGTCVKSAPRAKAGEACGTGFSGIAVLCEDGLDCKHDPSAPGAADEMGTCTAK